MSGPGGLGLGGSGTGHAVNHEDLHKFAGDLDNYKNQSDQIGKLIHEADVGDKSWGVVGLFTKQQYTNTLNSLVGHVREMTEGFGTLSDKIKTAADGYKGDDDKIKDTFKQLLDELNGKGGAPGGSSGAGPVGGGFNGPNIDQGMGSESPGVGTSTPGGSSEAGPVGGGFNGPNIDQGMGSGSPGVGTSTPGGSSGPVDPGMSVPQEPRGEGPIDPGMSVPADQGASGRIKGRIDV